MLPSCHRAQTLAASISYGLSSSESNIFSPQQQQQHQLKDGKGNQFLELVILHNNMGVKCYNQKKYSAAQHLFQQMNKLIIESYDRLFLLVSTLNKDDGIEIASILGGGKHSMNGDESHRSSSALVMDDTPFDNPFDGTKDSDEIMKKEIKDVQKNIYLTNAAQTMTASTASSLSSTHQIQRSEYDEGMHAFKGAITLDENDFLHKSLICSRQTGVFNKAIIRGCMMEHAFLCCVVAYNQAHVCHEKGDAENALRYLRLALNQYNLLRQQQQLYNTNNAHQFAQFPAIISRTMILGSIGFVYYEQSQMLEALSMFNEALKHIKEDEDIEKSKSSEWEVALILNCIGVLHFHMKGFKAGIEMKFYEAALEIQEDLIDNLNVETALSIQRLSSAKTTKDLSGGQQQPLLERAKVVINAGIATTLNNIGRAHYNNGDYLSALRAYQESLRMRTIYLMATFQLDIAATIYNTGQTFHQLGQLDEALMYYEEYLTISTNHFGTRSHEDIAIVLRCIAQIHHERSNYDKAEGFYLEALESIKLSKNFGPNHPEIASTLNKLGNMYFERGSIDLALEAYQQGLEVETSSLEDDHPNIAVTLSIIGQIWKLRGDYSKALYYYKQSLKLQLKRLASSAASKNTLNPELALTISSIAAIHYHMEEYDKALDLFQEALCIRVDVYGDDHLDVSASLNSIGMVLFKKGLNDFALEAFIRSYDIRRNILGEYHSDVAIVLNNIAAVYLQTGDDDRALVWYKRTLEIEHKTLGCDHIDASTTLENIAKIYKAKGNVDCAILYFKESISIEQRHFGYVSMPVAQSFNNLANLYLQTNQTPKAIECFASSLRIYRKLGHDDDSLSIVGLHIYTLGLIHPNAAPAA